MQHVLGDLIAAGTGAVAGCVQLWVFLRHPGPPKAFSAHMADLRPHFWVAFAISLAVVVSLECAERRFVDPLGWFEVYWLGWFGIPAVLLRLRWRSEGTNEAGYVAEPSTEADRG